MDKSTIIFEGLNCVGKSSLIKLLHKDKDIYVHNNRTEFQVANSADATYGYMKAFVDMINFSKTPMWFDRFHFTEYTYGVVKRGYNEYTASKLFAEIDYRLSENGNVKLVYLQDDVEEIYKRTAKLRGWGNIDIIKELNERIERCVEASCLPIMSVNYKELIEHEDYMDKLINFVKGE